MSKKGRQFFQKKINRGDTAELSETVMTKNERFKATAVEDRRPDRHIALFDLSEMWRERWAKCLREFFVRDLGLNH